MKHEIEEIMLANGAKGLLINVPGATVLNIQINLRAGHYLVERSIWEVPHIMEHMVLGANKCYPKARLFQAEFEKNGAYSNASTSTYSIDYLAECADFEWRRILNMLKLSIEQPIFLAEEFAAERGNVREELTGYLNNHFRQLVIAARNRFGFISMPDGESLALLDDIKLEDIREFYQRTHRSGNVRLIVAGNIKRRRNAIMKMFENIHLPDGQRFNLPDEIPVAQTGPLYLDKPGVENLYFLIETYGNTPLEPADEDALILLNVMLTNTLHSRILGEARERGLVYHMSSNFNNLKKASSWWFGAQVIPDNAPALFEIINRELGAVLKGNIADSDIEAARQYCLGKYQRGIQTVNGLVKGYGGGYFFDGRIDDYYAIPERYRAVTKQHMVDVARTMFRENVWGLSVLGTNRQKMAEGLYNRITPLWN